MTNSEMFGVFVASLAGGTLKVLRMGKLTLRRWLAELIGAVLIGNFVFTMLQDYTSISTSLSLSVVSMCAVIWTHILDMFKNYLNDKFQNDDKGN